VRDDEYTRMAALEDDFWWYVGMRDVQAALLDAVVADAARRRAGPPREADIVDLGCGTGANLGWLERYGTRVTGLDVGAPALRACRARGRTRLVQASSTDLPFAPASFDVATSFDVLVQLPRDGSDDAALVEMHRVLRPGGVAMVRAAAYEWMRSGHDEALGSTRRYTRRGLARQAEAAGFEVVRATYANCLLFPLAAVHRLALRRAGLREADSDVQPLPRALRWAGGPLTAALRAEARLLRRAWARLPFGLSVVLVLRRPAGA